MRRPSRARRGSERRRASSSCEAQRQPRTPSRPRAGLIRELIGEAHGHRRPAGSLDAGLAVEFVVDEPLGRRAVLGFVEVPRGHDDTVHQAEDIAKATLSALLVPDYAMHRVVHHEDPAVPGEAPGRRRTDRRGRRVELDPTASVRRRPRGTGARRAESPAPPRPLSGEIPPMASPSWLDSPSLHPTWRAPRETVTRVTREVDIALGGMVTQRIRRQLG